MVMLCSQFAKSNLLRGISNGLRPTTDNLNHIGLSMASSKSTIGLKT